MVPTLPVLVLTLLLSPAQAGPIGSETEAAKHRERVKHRHRVCGRHASREEFHATKCGKPNSTRRRFCGRSSRHCCRSARHSFPLDQLQWLERLLVAHSGSLAASLTIWKKRAILSSCLTTVCLLGLSLDLLNRIM